MILVVGGAAQGKRQVCRRLLEVDEKAYQNGLADGRTDAPEIALEKPYIAAFHLFLRKVMEQGGDPERYAREVLAAEPKILSLDEIGCGIVPIKASERDYRDAVGRCGQLVAKEATQVYRVICGIPARIK